MLKRAEPGVAEGTAASSTGHGGSAEVCAEPAGAADLHLQELSSVMNAAIDSMGAGPYQLIALLFGGGVYMAEGSFLLMLSIVAKGLIVKWDLSPWLAGAMASVLFGGLIVGTVAGGFACDRHGRRMPILVTYLGIAVFTFVGILAPGLLPLLAAKFMLGICLGFGVPASNAIVAESCPPSHRSNIYCMTMVLFSMGQLYSATIVWVMNPTLHHDDMEWRGMMAAAALLPSLLLVLAYFFLLESPHWLMLNGRISEARDVITAMHDYKQADSNGQGLATLRNFQALTMHLRTPAAAARGGFGGLGDGEAQDTEDTPLLKKDGDGGSQGSQTRLQKMREALLSDLDRVSCLFSPTYRLTTALMLYVTCASNFAYYGMIYGLPDTLQKAYLEEEGSWSPAAGLIVAALFEIPGVFIAVVLGATIGRRLNMSVAFFGCACFLVCTVCALSAGKITDSEGMLSVLGVKLFLATGYIIVYLYLLECYPTKFRATGLAFCMVLGRLGAACCPVLYDGMQIMRISPVWFFVIMACMMAGAGAACCVLPYETKDASLEEDAPPGTTRAIDVTPLLTPGSDRLERGNSS
mmetsp:Transcript_2864/g.8867  ORF Transcript_2864/g.8867 Transcript_2864/m.8867 type:complete len:580 (-) Transcript_2864:69-1808(-)